MICFNFRPTGKQQFLAPEYSCITPLRLLMLKQTDTVAWERLSLLMDHDEDRKKETEYQKMFQVNKYIAKQIVSLVFDNRFIDIMIQRSLQNVYMLSD